jgi:hypothetical protein
MANPYKRFATIWLAATLTTISVIVLLNLLVDPAGAYPGLHLSSFEPWRYLDLDRVTKAEMAGRGDWQVMILGSSRAESGLPADHPFLTTNRACNLSFAAARFPELVSALDFAAQHNPLEHVILCLDMYMFSRGSPWVENFAESRFNPNLNTFSYYCKQLLGRACTDRTWDTIRRRLRNYRPVPQETRGFHNHSLAPTTSQRELFSRVMRILGAGYRRQTQDPAYMEQFRHLVRVCRDRKIDLKVAIMPVHALDLELLYASGRWSEFEQWKADLVKVMAEEGVEGKFSLWDFTAYAGPQAETVPPEGDVKTRMKYYFENSHFTTVLGGVTLDAMFGAGSTNALGVQLDRSNLNDHLARILADRENYARTNAPEIQWVQRILAESNAKPAAQR